MKEYLTTAGIYILIAILLIAIGVYSLFAGLFTWRRPGKIISETIIHLLK